MDKKDFKNFKFTILGAQCKLKGEFHFRGDVFINSSIEGTIKMIDQGNLVFERGSSFDGTIYGHDIEIFSDVKGTIQSTGTLTIRSSANVSGNIRSKNLIVYPGAILNIEGHTEDS